MLWERHAGTHLHTHAIHFPLRGDAGSNYEGSDKSAEAMVDLPQTCVQTNHVLSVEAWK